MLLAVTADAPLIGDVVAFLDQRILQPNVLQEPVAQRIAVPAAADAAIVVAAILR